MNLLKGITFSIGWLSGSLAGFAAILYAFGYLITRAQQHALGLDGLSLYGNEHFLQEGAKFFVATGEFVIDALLIVLVGGLVLAVAALVPYGLLRRLGVATLAPAAVVQQVLTWARALRDRLPWPWAACGYLVLIVVLVLYFLSYRQMFLLPLGVSNTLYTGAPAAAAAAGTTPRSPQCPDPRTAALAATSLERLIEWILSDCKGVLNAYYKNLVYVVIEGLVLLVVAGRPAGSVRNRIPLMLPLVVIVVLYTVYLPMAYGVLVRPTRYNRITVQMAPDAGRTMSGRLFLLNKNDHEFIVWDAVGREVLWIPSGQVQGAQISRADSLFREDGR